MAIRWRDGGNGDLLCAATHPEEKGDLYIDDELHYRLAVIVKVLIPDDREKENGRWYWMDNIMAKLPDFKIEINERIAELEKTLSSVLEMIREDIRTGKSDGTFMYQIEAEIMKALGERDEL